MWAITSLTSPGAGGSDALRSSRSAVTCAASGPSNESSCASGLSFIALPASTALDRQKLHQSLPCRVEPRFHCFRRDAQRRGDIVVIQLAEVPQDDDLPVVGRKCQECPLHQPPPVLRLQAVHRGSR